MFKFTLYILTFILSFGLFLAYLTAFQHLAPAPAQQAEQHPLVGIRPEHAAAGQAMTSATQLSAPGSPSSAPGANVNDLSGKYRECVIETIKAQQAANEADEERFVREARCIFGSAEYATEKKCGRDRNGTAGQLYET
jgi:hypothetical protein